MLAAIEDVTSVRKRPELGGTPVSAFTRRVRVWVTKWVIRSKAEKKRKTHTLFGRAGVSSAGLGGPGVGSTEGWRDVARLTKGLRLLA